MTLAAVKKHIKQHEGLYVVFAGLIVFGTYLAKEGVREKYKEWAEAIDTAEFNYRIAGDLTEVRVQLREILQDKREHLDKPLRIKSKADLYAAHRLEVLLGTNELFDANAQIENLSILIRKLPDHTTEECEVAHLRQAMTLSEAVLKDRDIMNYEEATGDKFDSTVDMDKKLAEDEALRERENEKDGKSARDRLDVLKVSVTARALKEREEYEKLNNKWKMGSAILFTLGWGLGLVAKWAGIEDEDEDPGD